MFSIVTDTSSNLDEKSINLYNITVIPFSFYIGQEEYTCTDITSFDGKGYSDSIRGGCRVTTSQVTPQRYIQHMQPLLEQGQDILFIGMSSGVSGSFASAQLAAQQLEKEFPHRRIELVDTLGASLGEGLLVIKAARLRAEGMDIEKVAAQITKLRTGMCQVFTVDDLKYLRMTGRLSGITCIIGTMLNIKPILKGNSEGKIICFKNVRGRRQAVKQLAEQYIAMVKNAPSQTVGISHADCPEDAEYLKQLISAGAPPKEIMTVCFEPVTGSHVGPGTLALFFFGDETFRSKEK